MSKIINTMGSVSKKIAAVTNSILENRVHKNKQEELSKLLDDNADNGIQLTTINKNNGGNKKKQRKTRKTKKNRKTKKTYLMGGYQNLYTKLTINPMVTREEAREEARRISREEAAREARRISREEAAREAIERRIARRTQLLLKKDNVTHPVTPAVMEEYKLKAKDEISIELIHEAELELDSD